MPFSPHPECHPTSARISLSSNNFRRPRPRLPLDKFRLSPPSSAPAPFAPDLRLATRDRPGPICSRLTTRDSRLVPAPRLATYDSRLATGSGPCSRLTTHDSRLVPAPLLATYDSRLVVILSAARPSAAREGKRRISLALTPDYRLLTPALAIAWDL